MHSYHSCVMNAPSIVERKDCGEVSVVRTNGVHMRFDFKIRADPGREGLCYHASDCETDNANDYITRTK